jgi:hypothetical protein
MAMLTLSSPFPEVCAGVVQIPKNMPKQPGLLASLHPMYPWVLVVGNILVKVEEGNYKYMEYRTVKEDFLSMD